MICEGHCVYFGGEIEDNYKEVINFLWENCLSENMKKELRVFLEDTL